jgi:hypothetical protein
MADDALELSADLFSPLTNELRVRIVVALGRHQAEHPDDRSLSFNELRDRVGGPDSGQFNYLLEQLQGPYVWHADGEYGLTLAGERVVGAIRSGTNDVDAERGPFDIDATDPLTGEPLAVEWRNGFLVVRGVEEPVRDAGFLYREAVPPGMLSERDVESALAFSFRVSNNRYSMFMSGVCPLCYGPADRRIELATAGDGTGRRSAASVHGVVTGNGGPSASVSSTSRSSSRSSTTTEPASGRSPTGTSSSSGTTRSSRREPGRPPRIA